MLVDTFEIDSLSSCMRRFHDSIVIDDSLKEKLNLETATASRNARE